MRPVTDFAVSLAHYRYERAMCRGRGVDDAYAALEVARACLCAQKAAAAAAPAAPEHKRAEPSAMPHGRNCRIYVRHGREMRRVA